MSQQTQSRPPLQLQPWNRCEDIELHQKPQSKASKCRAQTHQRVTIWIGNSSGGVPGAGQSGYFEKIKPIQNRSGLAIERLKRNTHTDQSNLDNAAKHQIKSERWQSKHRSHQQHSLQNTSCVNHGLNSIAQSRHQQLLPGKGCSTEDYANNVLYYGRILTLTAVVRRWLGKGQDYRPLRPINLLHSPWK